MEKSFLDRYFKWLVAGVIAINAVCFFTAIFPGDSALYASISKTILRTHDWFNLYAFDKDWLDKPHLPFWIAALSFKIFGFSSFAYKLPGFLFWCVSLYFTFKAGALLFSEKVARVAVLIFGTCLHTILSNIDLRAESFLTAFIIAGTYFAAKAHFTNKTKWFIFTAFAAAGAIMTKGIFTLITIFSGYFLYLLFNRQLKAIFNLKWLLCVALTFIFISPELIALYVQFDLHPEKIVFGHTNVSGIRFFLWDSQFGRFLDTGPIKGKGDLSFFLHTTAWAFLPWTAFLIAGIVQIARRRNFCSSQVILSAAAGVTFVIFSLSKFQLPHYIVIVFPHLALISASYIVSLQAPNWFKGWRLYQAILSVAAAALIIVLAVYSGIGNNFIALGPVWACAVASVILVRKIDHSTPVLQGVIFSAMLFYFLGIFFYPALLRYDAGRQAAEQFNDLHVSERPLSFAQDFESFSLYSDTAPVLTDTIPPEGPPRFLYLPITQLNIIKSAGRNYQVIDSFEGYRITILKKNFLNPATRSRITDKSALIKLY